MTKPSFKRWRIKLHSFTGRDAKNVAIFCNHPREIVDKQLKRKAQVCPWAASAVDRKQGRGNVWTFLYFFSPLVNRMPREGFHGEGDVRK